MACPAVAVGKIVPSSVCGIDVLVFPDCTGIDRWIDSFLGFVAVDAVFETAQFD